MAQENEQRLEDIDPIFSVRPKQQTAPATSAPAPAIKQTTPASTPAAATSKDSNELDTILGLPPPSTTTTTTTDTQRKPTSELGFLETTTPREAGEYGAIAGAATGLIKPTMPRSTGIPQAQAQVAGSAANVQALQSQLAAGQTAQATTTSDLLNRLQAARAEYNTAQQALADARANAQRLSALPQPPAPATPPATPATPPGMGTTPDALSEGAMRHSAKMGEIRSANEVRKGIAGYRAGLPASERMPLTGYTQSSRLIVPNELANAPLYNQEQIAAQQRLAAAETAFKSAQTDLNRMQSAVDRLTTSKPLQNTQSQLEAAQRQQAVNRARLASLEKTGPGTFSTIGKVASLGGGRLPNLAVSTAGGALAGYEGMNAYLTIRNELQKDQPDYLKMLMHTLGATSGALMATPNFAAKGAGAVIGMPPLAYHAYQQYGPKATELPEGRKPFLPQGPGGQ